MKFSKLILGAVFSFLLLTPSAYSQTNNNKKMEKLKEIVRPFYTKILTVGGANGEDLMAIALKSFSKDWQTIGNPDDVKKLEDVIGKVSHFHKGIPDLKWNIQEMLVDGNRVIVRSIATGTPNIPNNGFFGVPTDGTKSFEFMSIDIHTIESGKIITSYHLENWSAAIKQIKGE